MNRRGLTLLEIMIAIAILSLMVMMVYGLTLSSTDHISTHATTTDLDMQCRRILDLVERDLREAFSDSVVQTDGLYDDGTWIVSHSLQLRKPVLVNKDTNGDGVDDVFGQIDFDPATRQPKQGPLITWASTLLAEEGVGSNGKDDDHDRMIDESSIVRTEGTPMRLTEKGTSRWGGGSAAVTPVSVSGNAPHFEIPDPNKPAADYGAPPAIYFATEKSSGNAVTVTVTLQGVDSKNKQVVRSLVSVVRLRNTPPK